MTDDDRTILAARLRARNETVQTLHTITKYGPPTFTAIFALSALLTLMSMAGPNLDEAAVVVTIVMAPCAILAWLLRLLIRSLLRNLDLCEHDDHCPDPPSPRQ